MEKTAAVIVTYNRRDKLLRCMDAVRRQTADVIPDIYVVDNNSSDGTEEAVRDYIKKTSGSNKGIVLYYNLRYNSGGAGGFTFGIRKAVETGYDYLWLMDDDCVPADDALEHFLEFDREHKGEYGFLSGKALWRDGSLCRMNIQRKTVTKKIKKMPDGPERIEMASFVSLFVPAASVLDSGLPVRQFFIWTDDWEYTRRISRRKPCWIIPSSMVLHDCDQNSGADISSAPEGRIDRFRYLYRNDVYLYRREGIRGFAYEAARLALHTARIAVSRNSFREKLRRTSVMLKGTAEGLAFYPEPDRVYPAGKNEG